MFADILARINWVDIFVLILLARICFISIRTGLPIEIFKFFGLFSAIYLGLHYYVVASDFAAGNFGFREKAPEFLRFFIFVLLSCAGYLAWVGVRVVFYRFIKLEATPKAHKFGGLILGLGRAFFLASLMLFAGALFPLDYFRNCTNSSFSGGRIIAVGVKVYQVAWDNLFSKFFPQEKFNDAVYQIIKPDNEIKKESKPEKIKNDSKDKR